MERLRVAVVVVALAVGAALVAGCNEGPMQRTGERIDRALDQDRVLGRGPLEKAGRDVDKAVEDAKR